MRKIFLSAAVIALTLPFSALARDAKIDAAARDRVAKELSCSDKVPALVGACIRDKLKTIKVLRERFKQDMEDKADAWHAVNDKLGLSPEYYAKMKQFQKEIAEEREAYNDALVVRQRELEAERKKIEAENKQTGAKPTPIRATDPLEICRRGDRTTRKKCNRALQRKQAAKR